MLSAAFLSYQRFRLPVRKVAQPNAKCRFAVAFGTLAAASVPTELRADKFYLLRFGISLTQQSQGIYPEN